MVPISILDLSPLVVGGSAAQALRNTLDLARHAERWGYHRYWLAEHHNIPSIASSATSVLIGYVAGGTSTMRVGAGGIMLPNHSPLVVAEQFGTLESLYPGRIDLGLGRAPGSDPITARALRHKPADADAFPQDVLELMAYLRPVEPGQLVQAVPGAGTNVPIWILGSSLFGAQLAAALGLPYGFASYFAPALMMEAIEIYRRRFRPSAQLERPYVMLSVNAYAAETDEDARLLMTSLQQALLNVFLNRPAPLPPPVEDYESRLSPPERAALEQALACTIVGSPATVRRGLEDFVARTGADELMLVTTTFDHAARLRSFEIMAEAHAALAGSGAR